MFFLSLLVYSYEQTRCDRQITERLQNFMTATKPSTLYFYPLQAITLYAFPNSISQRDAIGRKNDLMLHYLPEENFLQYKFIAKTMKTEYSYVI